MGEVPHVCQRSVVFLVLWCFVLTLYRRSPYTKSHLELRDELRVSSLVHAIRHGQVPLFGASLPYKLKTAHPHMVVSVLGDLGMYHVGADVNG